MSLSATDIKISEYVKIIDPRNEDWETGAKFQKNITAVSDSVTVG